MRLHGATFVVVSAIMLSGCLPFIYHDRQKVLIPGIDIDQTLDVAVMELESGSGTSVLTLWAMRDQIVTPAQARRISGIYFEYIDEVDSEHARAREFQVWHLTWAISNLYREGGDAVKEALADAFGDAAARVEKLDGKAAKIHFGGEKIYMGDAHGGGRAYAEKHLVVPGNASYLQSSAQYGKAGKEPQLMLYAEPTRKDVELLGAR